MTAKPQDIPFRHRLPLTRMKLLGARILYFFLKTFLRNNHRFVTRKGINYILDLSEGIDLSVFVFGAFQSHVVRSPYMRIRQDAIILDVGANIGTMTLPFAQLVPEGHVYAFEASVFAYSRLVSNLALNPRLHERITPIRQFVTNHTETVKRSRTICSSWNLSAGHQARHRIHGGIIRKISPVKSISLDSFCQQNTLPHLDLIKIDTDGHEWKILQGSKKIMKIHRPCIILEVCLDVFNEGLVTVDDYFAFFSQLQYTLVNSKNGRTVNRNNFYKEIPLRYTTDIVAVPL